MAEGERLRRLRAPRPLRLLGRVVGLPVREVGAYWYQERNSIRRGLGALMVSALTGMIAGLVLSSATGTLEELPGLLLVVPAAIGMRGSIYGTLASRLSTAIHVGEYERELRWSGFLGRQVEATSLLTLGSSVVVAAMAWIVAAVLGLPTISVWHLVVITTVGGVLSSVILLVLTVALSRYAQEHDWNMDDVAAPTITVAGDVLTVPALLLAALVVGAPGVATALGVVLAVAGAAAMALGWQRRDEVVRRIVRESALTLVVAVAVLTLAGTILESRLDSFVEAPWLLVLIPPFIATCGSLGGMLSSRLASKLHLGAIEPRLVPGAAALLDGSLSLVFGTLAFTALGLTAWATSLMSGFAPPVLPTMVGITLLAGVVSTFLLIAVAYLTAAASYRFGLDPDNEGIPIVTSVMDVLGLLALVAVVALAWNG